MNNAISLNNSSLSAPDRFCFACPPAGYRREAEQTASAGLLQGGCSAWLLSEEGLGMSTFQDKAFPIGAINLNNCCHVFVGPLKNLFRKPPCLYGNQGGSLYTGLLGDTPSACPGAPSFLCSLRGRRCCCPEPHVFQWTSKLLILPMVSAQQLEPLTRLLGLVCP